MKSEAEFIHMALHSYENRQCNTVEEFDSDLNRIGLIKKCLNRYRQCGDISARLVLNHIVILFNVFGKNAFELIVYKMEPDMLPLVLPFLKQQNRIPPEYIYDELDSGIIKELEQL